MELILDILRFDWDEGNREKNVAKHSVSNKESEEVFGNSPLLIFDDARHSLEGESRYLILGKTNEGRTLSLVVTRRGGVIRVISARSMSRKERKIYENSKIYT